MIFNCEVCKAYVRKTQRLFPFLSMTRFQRLSVFILLLVLFSGFPGIAQEKRPFIIRTLDWGYKIVQGDSASPYKKYYFAVPIIAYKPESRWVLGVSLAYIFRTLQGDGITRPSIIRANVSYSQEHQFAFRPYVEIFTKRNKFNFRGQYNYTDFAEYYWGIGSNTPAANKELYKFQMNKLNQKAAYMVLPKFYAGIQYAYEQMYNVRFEPGSQLELSGLRGSKGYYEAGPGVTMYYDDRDNVYAPIKGHIIELSNVFYHSLFGSGSNFVNFTFDARKYKQLWKENVLASQFFFNFNEGNIPFRMKGVLGSEMFMRGYYNGRYRDNHAMAFQTELRKTVWGPLGCVVFAGFGNVSNVVSGLLDNIKPNYGAGIRFKAIPREKMNMRLDYGFGSGDNRALYITLNEAF